MRPAEAAALRLHALRLDGPRLADAAAAVGWLAAVQSQDYGPATWSVAQRTGRLREPHVDRAYDEGSILRTHLLRPTWHFVPRDDIRWMVEVTAPRVQTLNAYQYRQLQLDAALLARCNDLLARALEGGRHATRREVEALLRRHGVEAKGPRLAYILMNAELNCVVCSGARQGRQHTYALLAERAPAAVRLDRDQALVWLARRYFTSHGPASLKDFRGWSSLAAADAKRALEMVAGELQQTELDGVRCWFAEPGAMPRRRRRAHLLQGYDEYVMGYSDTRHVVDPAGRFATLGQASVYNGVLIVDGRLAGRWRRTAHRTSVTIEAALYGELEPAATAAVREAADRYARFLGLEPALVTTRL